VASRFLAFFALAGAMTLLSGCEQINDWKTRQGSEAALEGDLEGAVGWWEGPAEYGNVEAVARLGEAYLTGKGIATDEARGVELILKAAKAGHPVAQAIAARIFREGLYGQNPNIDRAVSFAQRSANAKEIRGYAELAAFYAKGLGVIENKNRAHKLWLMAAESGDITSQTMVGRNFETGTGTTADPELARQWYEKAAAQGDAGALNNLAGLFKTSEPQKALDYYREAANRNHKESWFTLCQLSVSADKLPISQEEIIQWCEKSRASGDAIAGIMLHLASTMTPIPDQPFRMSKYETTRGEWAAYVNATGKNNGTWNAPGFEQDDTHPVVNISWDDIQGYLTWLNDTVKPAKPYRLPTEEEWEIAARGGVTTDFPWGNEIEAGKTNCSETLCADGYENTSPVGKFPPNNLGIHDVVGNVWEWTASCYDGDCDFRVLRSGSWFNFYSAYLQLGARITDNPGGRSVRHGFRIAQDN
jgi:TPR repeat protein